MFTGIVQAVAPVLANSQGVLLVDPRSLPFAGELVTGESIAVNGCCLTLVDFRDGLQFDLSPETLSRTALSDLRPKSLVNIERALRPVDHLGGHFVQGHVDAVGTIESIRQERNSSVFTFSAPAEYARYLIDKGSICIDGVSLTVVAPKERSFDVWVIPHTLQNTSLVNAKPGQRVNLEFDMLAKYVEKLLSARG